MRAFMVHETESDSPPSTPAAAEKIERRSVTKSHHKSNYGQHQYSSAKNSSGLKSYTQKLTEKMDSLKKNSPTKDF